MLSQKTRYTIRALQHLADCWRQGSIRLDAIAEAQNIPRKFLTVILSELVREHFDLRPRGIVNMLNLLRPIYSKSTNYSHFGKINDADLTWEITNKAEALKKAAK